MLMSHMILAMISDSGSKLVLIREVILCHWAWLMLGLVTVGRQVNHLSI